MQNEEIRLRLVGWHYVQIIRRVITRFENLSLDLVQPFGLTNMQALSLMFIARKPGASQNGLVSALESNAASISAILKRLEQRKLIVRCRVKGDARTNALTLSETGTALAEELQLKFDTFALAIGGTIPAKNGSIIQDWLKAILFIHEL